MKRQDRDDRRPALTEIEAKVLVGVLRSRVCDECYLSPEEIALTLALWIGEVEYTPEHIQHALNALRRRKIIRHQKNPNRSGGYHIIDIDEARSAIEQTFQQARTVAKTDEDENLIADTRRLFLGSAHVAVAWAAFIGSMIETTALAAKHALWNFRRRIAADRKAVPA